MTHVPAYIPLKGVPTERRSLVMAFDEYISMHQKCCRSVGTLFSCNRVHSSKWLSTESAIFWCRLNSNMLNISFAMGMSSYEN